MTLGSLFAWVLASSVAASLLLLLILLVKHTWGRNWPARWHAALWFVLLLKLALPGPLLRLPALGTKPSSGALAQLPWLVPAGVSNAMRPQAPPGPARPPGTVWSATPPFDIFSFVSRLWLVGTALFLTWLAWETLRFGWVVRRGHVVTRESVLRVLEEVKKELGIRTLLAIVETEQLSSPALFGVLRPRLLMPSGLLEVLQADDLRNIFRHELVHLRRWDLWVGWAVALLQAVHWFNPLLWFAFHRLRRDRELACDESAVWRLDPDAIAGYGQTLLRLAGTLQGPKVIPSLAGISETPSVLSRRIQMLSMLIPRQGRHPWPLASILALCALTGLSLVGTAPAPIQERKIPPAAKPAFQNDPALVGHWRAVDYVQVPDQFQPGTRQWKGQLFLSLLSFKPDGSTSGPWFWTRGQVYHPGDKTLGAYEIREIGGRPYLFMAWMNGDVLFRGEKPSYYVFGRYEGYDPMDSRMVDRLDYPFVDDPALPGLWKPVDLVDAPSGFIPGKRAWKDELMDFHIQVLPGGKTDGPWTWTRGLLLHPGDKTAARYEIRSLGGRDYLFFELKNGNYIFLHENPRYYVMVR
jgi:bla regulator protein blaR1